MMQNDAEPFNEFQKKDSNESGLIVDQVNSIQKRYGLQFDMDYSVDDTEQSELTAFKK